jgi:hypothetical protein
MKVYKVPSESQSRAHFNGELLGTHARRLMLGAMLRWIMRRYGSGQPVLIRDMRQLVSFADDANGEAQS